MADNTPNPRVVDATLADWSTLASDTWPTILIGNGFSINLWNGFGYKSLLDRAPLSIEAKKVFADLGTAFFEEVLLGVHHARLVADALGQDTTRINDLYANVRDSLFEAVNMSHVPASDVPTPTYTQFAKALATHASVYTTNYDLLLYWSQMKSTETVNIKDFFWNADSAFDPQNTNSSATLVHYLHGALHLWADASTGNTGKWTSASGNLLELSERYTPTSPRRPLFISEGTPDEKARALESSTYLRFCLERLRADNSDTVLFGHGLTGQDEHIINALHTGSSRRFAVSVYPHRRVEQIVAEKARIQEALTGHTVQFFNSETHPLGAPNLLDTSDGAG